MAQQPARDTIIRLVCFSALWMIAFAARLFQRGDPRWATKLGLFALFLIPTALLFWLAQRLTRYRIPSLIELFAMPFAAGALGYTAAVIRDVLLRPAQ